MGRQIFSTLILWGVPFSQLKKEVEKVMNRQNSGVMIIEKM